MILTPDQIQVIEDSVVGINSLEGKIQQRNLLDGSLLYNSIFQLLPPCYIKKIGLNQIYLFNRSYGFFNYVSMSNATIPLNIMNISTNTTNQSLYNGKTVNINNTNYFNYSI